MKFSWNEFHINKKIRDVCKFSDSLFASSGNVIFQNIKAVRVVAEKINSYFEKNNIERVSAGSLNAMGLIDEVFHYVCMLYRRDKVSTAFSDLLQKLNAEFGNENVDNLLLDFLADFPSVTIYRNKIDAKNFLEGTALDAGTKKTRSNREQTLEELMMLFLANDNPAFKKFFPLFDDARLKKNPLYKKTILFTKKHFANLPSFGPFNHTLIDLLKEPVVFSPTSLRGQLEYIIKYWADLLGDFLKKLLAALDTISEEEKAAWHGVGEPELPALSFENLMKEYERFSADSDWMPNVVLLAKTVLVWLDQLSKKYARNISRLDEIPNEELDAIRDEGFTGLWLIGLWERSYASRRIKQINGNPEAAASAYSLYDYEIAENIGGWAALANLRARLWQRGIRLASDMVPNHTGMDSKWVVEKPHVFMQRRDCPFPHYSFNGENLSLDNRVSVFLEDHYYSKTDCAVIFKRVDNQTGDVRYIYHGNDGTGLPWNDTAQIDFLNPEAREEVMKEIINVAKNFPIIRFDAAMVLAKKHIRRLWYPEPGHGGDIPTRSETGLSTHQFNDAIPNEFWREVVDRIAKEAPDTLLLAEAFWMMEGYFVRTLGMHRVYNSAFMNMLKKEENQKYRDTIKNTIKFDPQVLKRFVNFMNNPDEETAVAQFGKGDKYFGVCTLMVTMPGLPMFGHGQIEGFEEKYGMEYTKAYRNEVPDENLIARHWREIFPLMKRRWQFAQVDNFLLYDVWNEGTVNENVFAYSNNVSGNYSLIFYNNKYERASGWIKQSAEYCVKTGTGENDKRMESRSISEGLDLTANKNEFCLLYEARSALWFIRKSREICERGMFVSLNGFETQVYINIHRVEDTSDKKWSTLCALLQGRGCKDFQIEWEEFLYHDIYKTLVPFANKFIPLVKKLFDEKFDKKISPKKIKANETDAKKIVSATKKEAMQFYKSVIAFEKQNKLKLDSAKTQFSLFEKNFLHLVNHANESSALKKILDLRKTKTPVDFVNHFFALDKISCFASLCFAPFLSIANLGLAKKYNVARKISELANEMNFDFFALQETLAKFFALAPLSKKLSKAKSKKTFAYECAIEFMQSENAKLFCGKNVFNGVQWFKKETTEQTFAIFAELGFLQNDEKKFAKELYNMFYDVTIKSEYKCEKFVSAFITKKIGSKVLSPRAKKASKINVANTSDKEQKEKNMGWFDEEPKPASTSATKKTAAKKPAAKKPAAKKTVAKKAATKKVAAKPAAKKAPAKKAVAAKKPATKKAPAKKTVAKKVPAKKAPAKKPVAKKAPAKKVATKKTPAKK